MKNLSAGILFFSLLLAAMATWGGNFIFRKYQVNDGLSENTVQAIIQDKKGFIWLGTKDGLNRFDGNEFRIFRNDPTDPGSIGNSFIRSIFEDADGKLWIGTDHQLYIYDPAYESFALFNEKTSEGVSVRSAVHSISAENDQIIWIGTGTQGLFCYYKDRDSLVQISSRQKENPLPSDLVWRTYRDYSGSMWFGTRNGLVRYIRETNNFQTFQPQADSTPGNNEVLSIFEDSEGDLWIGTWSGGLFKLDRKSQLFINYFDAESERYITKIRAIYENEKNSLLIGSDDGLYLFNKNSGEYRRIDEPGNPYSLGDQNVYAIYRDREGGCWIGTYFGGVSYLPEGNSSIRHYYPRQTSGSLSGKAVSQFLEDGKGNLWIATEDGGLNYFDVKTEKFKTYAPQKTGNGLSYHNLHSLLIHQNQLWIGTFSLGIDVLDLNTNTWKNYQFDKNDKNSLEDNCVFSLYQNKSGEIFVGTPFGLSKYDPVHDNFIKITEVTGFIYDMQEDSKGYFWVTTYGNGVFRYDPTAKNWKNYNHEAGNDKSLAFNKVIDVYVDDIQRLWFGTEGKGLCRYNYETDDFSTIDQKSGLPNNVVYGILDDKYGNLWVSTNMGITRINPQTLEMATFTKEDGLQSNQFNFRSSYKAKNGIFYFGGINGFNSFHPDDLTRNLFVPPVVITSLELLDEDSHIQSDSTWKSRLFDEKRVRLKYHQASFKIDFVSMSFQAQEKNQYECYMEGLESRWRSVGNEKSLTYVNLPPGEYTFRVRGSNNDGIWNESGDYLMITILPPFWKSTLAYSVYILVLFATLFVMIRKLVRRSRERHRIRLDEFKLEKEKEMYESKIAFYTHLAHEIRNPVTLIKAPLESVLTYNDFQPEVRENLTVIDRNTDKLLEMVNQFLDFRKLGEAQFRLNIKPGDLGEFLTDLCFRFRTTAEQQGVDLQLSLPNGKIIANFDKDAMYKVVSNLLSNAIKFSKSRVILQLLEDKPSDSIEILVEDDGPGIEHKLREKVFEPFFQVHHVEVKHLKAGTGIGLTISKQLVDKHNGTIYIKDGVAGGCQFVVRFPFDLTVTEEEQTSEETHLSRSVNIGSIDGNLVGNDKMHILIVEDNEELRTFLEKNMRSEYAVHVSGNGQEALHILEQKSVDLVISDITMPGMDGLELAGILKHNDQYCHIPIILLSARTNLQTKLNGLEYGADIYIEKPFSMVYLKAQIASLIENRIRILDKFSKSPFVPYGTIASNKRDEEFLDRLNDQIEKNISDVDFSIDKLAFEMMMSRSNLQRKIKGVSGLVPNDYIRVYRLKKAARLLLQGDYRINEICYLVGFNSGSYFSKCFFKQFGVLPKDFVKMPEGNEFTSN